MYNSKKKGIETKIVLLIVFTCFSFLFIIFFNVLKEIPLLSLFVKDYIEGGRSFFIPIIPTYVIFSFLPQGIPNYFSIGHLIDLCILINLNVYIEASMYHYLKKGLLNHREAMTYNIIISINNLDEYDKIEEKRVLYFQDHPHFYFGNLVDLVAKTNNKNTHNNTKIFTNFLKSLKKRMRSIWFSLLAIKKRKDSIDRKFSEISQINDFIYSLPLFFFNNNKLIGISLYSFLNNNNTNNFQMYISDLNDAYENPYFNQHQNQKNQIFWLKTIYN